MANLCVYFKFYASSDFMWLIHRIFRPDAREGHTYWIMGVFRS
jgi:hypothetical protein